MKKFDVIVNPFTNNVIVEHKSKDGSETIELKADGLIDSWSSFTMDGFRHTRIGIWCTHALVSMMERVGMAPQGSSKVSNVR